MLVLWTKSKHTSNQRNGRVGSHKDTPRKLNQAMKANDNMSEEINFHTVPINFVRIFKNIVFTSMHYLFGILIFNDFWFKNAYF